MSHYSEFHPTLEQWDYINAEIMSTNNFLSWFIDKLDAFVRETQQKVHHKNGDKSGYIADEELMSLYAQFLIGIELQTPHALIERIRWLTIDVHQFFVWFLFFIIDMSENKKT